jgi:hypothetical protein
MMPIDCEIVEKIFFIIGYAQSAIRVREKYFFDMEFAHMFVCYGRSVILSGKIFYHF